MSIEDYGKALKLGQQDYHLHLTRGLYPYLPILEENLTSSDIESEQNLGLVAIPADRIIGTYSAGRRTSFAPNFMPLLDTKTEFASKWSSLLDSHLDEGIRDPIKAVEFMNRFYVIEGNKRVSVLKYCDAVTIMGEVTRIIPKRTDDPDNRIYFEFIDFYKRNGINYIWFSKEGSFKRLETKVIGEELRLWTEDEKMDFHSAYIRFSNAFYQRGGKKLPITTGDALLGYLEVHTYEELKEKMSDQILADLVQMWNEILMLTEKDSVELVMDPEKGQKKNILTRILAPSLPGHLNITFINDKTPEISGWTYAHELGRLHLEDKFGAKVTTAMINDVRDDGSAEAVIEAAIESGSDLIFTTTPQLLVPSLKAAIDHPDARILNCSVNISHRYIRTYYNRLYEAKFLIGMIAGAMSENARIGYVADYPIYGMTSNINAFALGARMVNPRVQVFLDWSTREGYEEHKFIHNTDISYVSMHDMVIPERPSRKFGLYSLLDEENLAMPLRDWGRLYELIVDSIFNGRFDDSPHVSGQKAVNYLWGMSAGVVDVLYSRRLPAGIAHLVDFMKESIKKGTFLPFSGTIRAQDGSVKCDSEHTLSPEEIVTMNWLVDNVNGSIPHRKDLTDEAKKLVEILGLNNDEEEK